MRSGRFKPLFAIVLCTGVLAGALPAQETPDAAEAFAPYWRSVTLQSQLYNPVEEPNRDPNAETTLQISGGVRILDDTALVGIDRRANAIVAFDQDGVEIYASAAEPPISRSYETIAEATRFGLLTERGNEISFGVSIPLDPESGYPSALSRVEWSMNVMMADELMTVDVPFEPNETWVELVPGLEILVDDAVAEEGRYSYHLQAIYDPNLASFSTSGRMHFWRDEVPPAVMMTAIDILNAEGEPVHGPGTSGGFSAGASERPLDGLRAVTATGSGRCSTCGDATTFRFTFALAPYEEEARLALEDIPVPAF